MTNKNDFSTKNLSYFIRILLKRNRENTKPAFPLLMGDPTNSLEFRDTATRRPNISCL